VRKLSALKDNSPDPETETLEELLSPLQNQKREMKNTVNNN
jgi:hypothetical protein